MSKQEHGVSVVSEMVKGKFTAICSCGWISAEESSAEIAAARAAMHVRGEYPPWVIPPNEGRVWTPERRTEDGP